jgi:hypothetical protein
MPRRVSRYLFLPENQRTNRSGGCAMRVIAATRTTTMIAIRRTGITHSVSCAAPGCYRGSAMRVVQRGERELQRSKSTHLAGRFRRLCATLAQPRCYVGRAAAIRGIERRKAVVAHPVQIRSTVQEVLRSLQLAAVASAPKGVRDVGRSGRCGAGERLLDTLH